VTDLTLIAGAGKVLFDGTVGATHPLGVVVISSAEDVTAASSFSATALTQSAGTGTTTFGGALTTSGNISIHTSDIIRNGPITAANLTFNLNSGGVLTSTAVGNISLTGSFTETGAAQVSLGRSITTTGGSISFDAPITMASSVTFDTSAANGNMNFYTVD